MLTGGSPVQNRRADWGKAVHHPSVGTKAPLRTSQETIIVKPRFYGALCPKFHAVGASTTGPDAFIALRQGVFSSLSNEASALWG